jgi:DNA polymerase elongation subunit (family B)
MRKLFFDIETIPAEDDKHEVLRGIHAKKKEDGKKVKEEEEFIADTSFNGAFGRIACLSYAIDDEPVKTFCGDERKILEDFWELAKQVDLFVGFNVMDFDLRFIYQRSMILGIRPSKELSFARYQKFPIYDVLCEWVKWAYPKKGTLHELAIAFGFPSSKEGEIEGKDVAQAFKDGRIKEISEYCEKDVEVTRKIYKRMVFEEK